jgi:chitodextrinase
MTAIPRYVSTATEAAARIAGYIFGDGNPDVQYNPLGGICFTCIATSNFQDECVRCAGVIGWTEGTQWAHASNGNFKVRRDALYAQLGITDQAHDLYHRALNPTATYTPTRVQVEAFMASIVETEGSFSTNPPKFFDEARGGVYDQRIDALVLTMQTQMPSAFRSGVAAKASLAETDAFPMPLITAARYPGDTPADWPDGAPPPPDETPPAIPTGLSVLAGNTQAIITWDIPADPDLAGYILYRDGSTEVYIGETPSFVESGLENDVEVCYQVASFDTSENSSALSSPVCATPTGGTDPGDTVPPDPPTALSGIAGGTTVTLQWTASISSDVAFYKVFQGAVLVAAVAAPTSFYVVSPLTPDTAYQFRLTAVDEAGNESTSTPFITVTTLNVPVDPPLITQQPLQIVSRLGCGVHQAYIAHRSGWPLLTELPATAGSWNRVTDDISEAKVTMGQANLPAECSSILQGVTRWAYELVIFRDGVRVHTGPIQDVLPEGEDLTITSRDKAAWLTVRPIWSELSYPEPGEEMATIFNDVITNAMAPDNVPGLVGTATATGLRAVREYLPNPPQYAWDAVEELCRTGIDFTMIGPTMVAGSFVVPASPIAFLTEQAFTDLPSTPLLGKNVATQWLVTGDPEQDLLASYGGSDALVGLVVRIAQEDDIDDQSSLDQNAKTRWELTSSPLIAESTFSLAPEAPWPVELMVPGCIVDIRFYETLFPVIGRHRLKRVEFNWSASGDGPSEQVQITVEPVGTELID